MCMCGDLNTDWEETPGLSEQYVSSSTTDTTVSQRMTRTQRCAAKPCITVGCDLGGWIGVEVWETCRFRCR